MAILLMIHSIVRWLIVLTAVIAVIKFAAGWLFRSKFKGMDSGLTSAFSGLMDLQVTLGLVFMIWNGVVTGSYPMYRIEHALTMLIAAGIGHLPARGKHSPDAVRFRNGLLSILFALVLVYLGVARLPGGWTR